MKRIATVVTLAGTLVIAGSTSAEAGDWACVAVDIVEVGTCVSDPYPDLPDRTIWEIIDDMTGVGLGL